MRQTLTLSCSFQVMAQQLLVIFSACYVRLLVSGRLPRPVATGHMDGSSVPCPCQFIQASVLSTGCCWLPGRGLRGAEGHGNAPVASSPGWGKNGEDALGKRSFLMSTRTPWAQEENRKWPLSSCAIHFPVTTHQGVDAHSSPSSGVSSGS